MTITRPVRPRAVEAFIAGAPDAGRKGVRKGSKEQITLTVAPELLGKVDALARRMGQSRAALINLAIFRLLEAEG